MRRQQSLYGEMKEEFQKRAAFEAEQRKLRAISEERSSKKSMEDLAVRLKNIPKWKQFV